MDIETVLKRFKRITINTQNIRNEIEEIKKSEIKLNSSKNRVNDFLKQAKEFHEFMVDELDDDSPIIEECEEVINTCYELQAEFQVILEKIDANRVGPQGSLFNASLSSGQSAVEPQGLISSKLPKLNLPSFNGDLDEWLSFKDIFESAVTSNSKITNIEKLQYLKSLLKGDALKLVKSFPITDENFIQAWETLINRYDNKKELIFNQIDKILMLPKVNSETHEQLFGVIDGVNEVLRSIQVLKFKIDPLADIMIVKIIQDKLDQNTRKAWELSLECKQIPKTDELLKFLELHARSLQNSSVLSGEIKKNKETRDVRNRTYFDHKKSVPRVSAYNVTFQSKCPLRGEMHLLCKCPEFAVLSINQRVDYVKKQNLCFNCLRQSHEASKCWSKHTCGQCRKRHHTMLHFANKSDENKREGENNTTDVSVNNHACLIAKNSFSNVLLATALVKVKDGRGNYQKCKMLIDTGSQANFVSKKCQERLGLQIQPTSVQVSGLSGISVDSTRGQVDIELSPHFNSTLKFNIPALILQNITSELSTVSLHKSPPPYLKGLTLADPQFQTPSSVDILLGADLAMQLFTGKLREGRSGEPKAASSKLGWILFGNVSSVFDQSHEFKHNHKVKSHLCSIGCEASTYLQRFWEIEAVPTSHSISDEDKNCEEFFETTTSRDESGRYTVKLPFKSKVVLGESRNQAVNRFMSLERKLSRDNNLRVQYSDFVNEYIALNHMEPVPYQSQSKPHQSFYLPHHGVVREESTTTKLRVVFDASAKSSSGTSLNDLLLTGPKLQRDLFNILLSFRTYPVALTADIEKMYRQIRVSPEDADCQRIVWRQSPSEVLTDYKLLTVTYGTSCAPYLAVKTVHQLARDEAAKYPLASEVTLRDFYVDDLLTGANTIEEARELMNDLIKLLRSGGFPLRKWISNKPNVISELPTEMRGSAKPVIFSEDQSVKILGILWDPDQDTFQIRVSSNIQKITSKRQLLSAIARIYDPIGLLTPTTVFLKILMQELWKDKREWDEKLTEPIQKNWSKFEEEMMRLNEIKVPRYISCTNQAQLELHGFCDASTKAYAAVIYLRSLSTKGEISISLIASKSRVAPLKTQTLPRLELCAAVLLVQLYKSVRESLNLTIENTYFWTDAEIVLAWIRAQPKRWKTFVANRVSIIHDGTKPDSWFHVRSHENPADCASRGILPSTLATHNLWWYGPPWLSEQQLKFPGESLQETFDLTAEEKPVKTHAVQTTEPPEILVKYSSFSKLVRIVAWCRRFIYNCMNSPKSKGSLSVKEMDEAVLTIAKMVQLSEFNNDITVLKGDKPLHVKNKLLPLSPFVDNQGLLRVGGRLNQSLLNQNQKHQIILPKSHPVTILIIQHYHYKYLHAGPQLVLSLIRQKFWIPAGRDIVRKVIRQCLTCFKSRAQVTNQIMANLPAGRVTPCRAFLNTGVDFAGPILTKPNLTRSKVRVKTYIALFVCFSTKAIHLEIVSELSSEAFLAALRRFVSRRGKPNDLFCDNATNFKGAKSILQSQLQMCKSPEVKKFLVDEAITWHFNPPSAPHFGGLWEAGVKSVKHHLCKTMKSSVLNYEELATLTTQIEAILNSRPITPLSVDPNDLEPLTPGHFLIGAPLLGVPELSPDPDSTSYVTRWKLLQRQRAHFWCRWKRDYLSTLQQRPKWLNARSSLQVGDMVIIKEDNLPPLKWEVARVTNTFPGKDNYTRVVEVKTPHGLFVRPVAKLCPLPFGN